MPRNASIGQTPAVVKDTNSPSPWQVQSLLHHSKQQHHDHHSHIHLSTETVQRTSLTLERIHHIQTRHRLSLRVLGVSDSITDDAFEESLEDAAGFFVDHYDA